MTNPDPDLNLLGLGVNRVTTRSDDQDFAGLNRALRGSISAGPVGGETRYSICRTASELAQAMQQQGGASLTGLGFLPLLSAKRRFFSQLKTTAFSLSVVVQARCVTKSAMLLEPTLLDGVIDSTPNDFAANYGDSFINSVSYGGEFIGVYTFRSETREQMQGLERDLEAGGLLMGLGTPLQIGLNLRDVLTSAQSSSSINVDFNYEVWGARKPSLQSDGLVDYALAFSSDMIEQAARLDLTTLGYERVPQLRSFLQPVVNNREAFTRDGGLMQQRVRMQELINQIEDSRQTLRLYGVTLADEGELDQAQRQAEADLQTYEQLVEAYQASPSTPLSLPTFPSLAIGSPQIAARVSEEATSEMGPGDTELGQPFLFPFSPGTAIQQRVRLTRLALETGRQLDRIILHYASRASETEVVEVHGGKRGEPSGDVPLAAGEGVLSLSSEFGTHLDRLQVTTDRGQLGGGGDRGDKRRQWQKAVNEVVLGFAGRSDDDQKGAVYLLRAVVARFEGIRWQPIASGALLDTPGAP